MHFFLCTLGIRNGYVGQPVGSVSRLETFYILEAFLRNLGHINSSSVCTARGAARTRTLKSLISLSESSLHSRQVLKIEFSPVDKRELWNTVFNYQFAGDTFRLSEIRKLVNNSCNF